VENKKVQTAEALQSRVEELEKIVRKKDREIGRLKTAIEQEKIYANAKANIVAAQTASQRIRDRYLQLLLNNSPNFIICFDHIKRIAFCSEALLKFTAENEESVSCKLLPELLEGFCEQKYINALERSLTDVLGENRACSIYAEINLRENDGRRKFIINFVPLTSSEAGNEGAMAIFHDVTAIERAREDAERASAAKSEFLSNMSHEMRTPMNAIIGMTAIARNSDTAERKEYCLVKIEEASNHLLGVINDILDMSKIEANKLELSFVNFNFEKMIQKVVNVINFRVEEKKQNFSVNLDPAIPAALICDDQRIAQIITNLLSNAVKFTPEGGTIRLDASLAGREGSVYTVQIEVTDTGIGISKEQQARLFSSFEQADSSTSRKFGGTGLGLAISKRLVEMMKGRVWIHSEAGKGATFGFAFPAERGEDRIKSRLSTEITWKNVRLLVVDDAPETLEYFESETSRLGLSCDLANSGYAALDFVAKNGLYDIYFIDYKMPGMDGIEVARRVKELSAGKPSMVIMISATEWSVIEEDANKAGVDRYLQKPLFHSDIVNCLNECFGVVTNKAEQAEDRTEDLSAFRILLVEDVEINREIVLALLEPTKLAIDCAENGVAAVNMVKNSSRPYDMIFMDVQMPEMDGYEATRKIREWEKTSRPQEGKAALRQIPIIAMTANVFREDVEKCLDAGMNSHVGKPLNIEDVMEKLRQYLTLN